jgi:hypothetical protein
VRVHTNTNLHVLAGLLEANRKILRLVVGVSTKRYALMLVKQEPETAHSDGDALAQSYGFCCGEFPRCTHNDGRGDG